MMEFENVLFSYNLNDARVFRFPSSSMSWNESKQAKNAQSQRRPYG